ncbi:MAG TPA: ATP-binding protein, partial [Paracoccaceae bacterium]|nr:ATP-binding protein [Paracoccaceae bacterium]
LPEMALIAHGGDGVPVRLAVTSMGDQRDLWQVQPEAQLAQAGGENRPDWDAVPFGCLRISPCGSMSTNAAFLRFFSEEAAEILRDQLDAGVLVSGRILLPDAEGRARLALVTITSRNDTGDEGATHEIFLFVPDGDTANQVSAAETLEALPVSLIQLDLEGRILWGNAQAREMLGRRFEPGRVLDELVQPLGRSLDSLMIEARSERGGTCGDMARIRDASYDVFAQVSLTRMVLQGQPCVIAVLNDASELRQLEDKFAQSQKMEAVGKLAGGVAHDFNNVLTAVSGHCDLLLLRKDPSHPDFSDLIQIRQNANRAATLVRQLLAFSRKQTLQPKLLSVRDVITETRYMLDRLIGEHITLTFEHGQDLGSVRADQQQLEQALMNLIVNARDAMPEGGTVTVATRNVALAIEEQRPGIAVPAGDYVEISVTDQGHGVDSHVIDRIFEPFFTTRPKGEGTGLGLSTVYGIVKQSGGYIHVHNLDQGGACFTILLPRAWADEKEDRPVEVAPVSVDLTGQGAVMLVEDEAPVRSFASRALRLRGYRVIEAESAEDAMALLSDDGEQVDVLVSDVVMPGMDGPTFADKARKLRPGLRVIFISGYAEDSFRQSVIGSDFIFLPKPFSLNELTSKVKEAMEASGMRDNTEHQGAARSELV